MDWCLYDRDHRHERVKQDITIYIGEVLPRSRRGSLGAGDRSCPMGRIEVMSNLK